MNPSTTPANNENVAYGQMLAQSSKLKRADQILLVKALAGQLGMIAMFPGQLTGTAVSGGSAKAGPKAKSKGPAKQVPTNPLSGTPEKKAFDIAKKAVAKATKANSGQKLAADHELVVALESAKDEYFRSLSSAKGPNSSSAKPKEDGWPSKEGQKATSPKGGETSGLPAKPPANHIKKNSKGVLIAWDGSDWKPVSSSLAAHWGL